MNLEKILQDFYEKGEKSDYIEEIKANYPYILGWLKNKRMKFNTKTEIVEKIGKALEKTENYCPCRLTRSQDDICPCKEMREENKCICGLYIKGN